MFECPHCRTPYSAGNYGRVKCPVCSQIVDLVPAGRYFTIHCCCGDWIQSAGNDPAAELSGMAVQIPYFCPRCGAQGTLTRSPAGRS